MSREDELREWAEYMTSPEVRADFAESERKVREWEREHRPLSTLDQVLDWIDQLRDWFGELPVSDEPWQGDDFRL